MDPSVRPFATNRSLNGVRSFQPTESIMREAKAAALAYEREQEIARLQYDLGSVTRSLARLVGDEKTREMLRDYPLPF